MIWTSSVTAVEAGSSLRPNMQEREIDVILEDHGLDSAQTTEPARQLARVRISQLGIAVEVVGAGGVPDGDMFMELYRGRIVGRIWRADEENPTAEVVMKTLTEIHPKE